MLTLGIMALRESITNYLNSLLNEIYLGAKEVPLKNPNRVIEMRVRTEVECIYGHMIKSPLSSLKRN